MKLRKAVPLLLAAFATPFTSMASAAPSQVVRIEGGDRFETAAELSEATFAPDTPVAVVATGEGFADALAGAPTAAAAGAPMLLVSRDAVPAPSEQELRRLSPSTVLVLGGESAVSQEVVGHLAAITGATVRRLSGASRYATAAAISEATFGPGVATLYVASGEGFADALSAGAAAAATRNPVLLTQRDSLPAETAAEINRLSPGNIVIVGGETAIGPDVAAQLQAYTSGAVIRFFGSDRFSTAVEVSKNTFSGARPTAYAATGLNFPDALAAGAAAGKAGGPLLLLPQHCMPDAVRDELDRLGVSQLVVLGGESAVSSGAAAGSSCTPPPPDDSCHASYEGTCIPPDVEDADCAGGTGNGPWYVTEKDIRVVGPDVFGLDADGDGIGCES